MITVYKFYADWCGPCKALSPLFENFKHAHPDVQFVDVDASTEQELVAKYKVRSLPTVIFEKGENTTVHIGMLPLAAYEQALADIGTA